MAQIHDSFTVIPIRAHGSQVLVDTDYMLGPLYAGYGVNPGVPTCPGPVRYTVFTEAHMRDGPAHPNPVERRLFWHDYAIRNVTDSLVALDGILPERAGHTYPGGDPCLMVRDLVDLIRNYDASHYGRIASLVLGQQPYHWCKPYLSLIPGCRLPGDPRPFDPSRDVRIMYSLKVGRAVSNSVFAVNPSLAFRIPESRDVLHKL